jgi:SAM-dependent methyltransferase
MNEQRFTGKAELYKKYRPSYPRELLDYLYSQVGFSKNSIIADIGAGTGIFSQLLLERGSTVFAVEPNDDMRDVAVEGLSKYSSFTPISATAECTGLLESSVDYVTVAEAFHYFNRQLFKQECKRILKPGGKLLITWNGVDRDSALIQKSGNIIDKYRIHDSSAYQLGGSNYEFSDFFFFCIYEHKTYTNDFYENREQFIGGNLSAGYAPNEEAHPNEYHGFVKELNILFDEYCINEIICFPFITRSYVGVMVAQ